jgi:type I restriction enzyme, S subunit
VSYLVYERYRPSHIEWAQTIPADWEECAVKISYSMQLGKMLQNDASAQSDVEISYLKALHVNWNRVTTEALPKMWASPSELKNYDVQNGDLLVCEGGEVGRAAILEGLDEPAIIQNALHRIRDTSRGDVRYFSYLLRNIAGAGWFAILCNKATIAHLTVEKLGSIQMPAPPLTEQKQIAKFLDWKTGQIDALIAKKKELMEKLKEKRLAVITQAVTKGINSAATLRDSGIPWLGDVPEHWQVMPLRRRWEIVDCKHKTVSYVDDGVPMASIQEVHDFEVNLEGANRTTQEEYLSMIDGGRRPEIGDIIYSRNATVGDAAIVTTSEKFCMGQDVCLLRWPASFPRFVAYLLRSYPLREQAEALMIGSTFHRINVGQIKGLWATVPSVDEQASIADFLDEKTGKIDLMMRHVESAITRLTEYRTALITAATTGKIDVRHVAIPAPT